MWALSNSLTLWIRLHSAAAVAAAAAAADDDDDGSKLC
jgi:hypothetical protein